MSVKNNSEKKGLDAFRDRRVIAVVAALVLVSVALVILCLRSQSDARTAIERLYNEHPLLDVSRNFIPQEHFITNIQPLRDHLYAYVEKKGLQNSVTLYFEVLTTGANININQNLHVFPASLLKVPTAMAAMHKVERGEWRADNRLVLFEQDVDPGFGTHYADAIGSTFTIEDLIRMALVESDNTANKILLRNLSLVEIAEALDEMGLSDVLLDEQRKISSREYARFFRTLFYSSYLSRANSEKLLKLLSTTPFDSYLGAGLPDDVVFSHKIGEDDTSLSYLDSGIVYVPHRPFLLTVAVTGMSEDKASEIMRDVSRLCYEYVASY